MKINNIRKSMVLLTAVFLVFLSITSNAALSAQTDETISASENRAAQQDYFPGYGYGDPDYEYKLGLEIDREFKHAYWKTEKEIIESTNYCELTISVELMANLEAQVGILKILKLFNITINGKIVAAAKVSFQLKKTLETQCRVKYEKNKIWFNLLRAKKGYWSTPEWEVCGKTYRFMEEPTGEEIVTDTQIQDPELPSDPDTGSAVSLDLPDSETSRAQLAVMIADRMSDGDTALLESLIEYFSTAARSEIEVNSSFIKMLNEIYMVRTVNEDGFSNEVRKLMRVLNSDTEIL